MSVAKKPKNPWDRQPKEPPEAYARFLVYRNLGPGRTLDAAYRVASNRTEKHNGMWGEESARYGWVQRARQWDVHLLIEHGDDIVLSFYESMRKLARKVATAIDQIEPDDWGGLLEALKLLGSHISNEAVEKVLARQGCGREPPTIRPKLAAHG
jgi:hypothetical protein